MAIKIKTIIGVFWYRTNHNNKMANIRTSKKKFKKHNGLGNRFKKLIVRMKSVDISSIAFTIIKRKKMKRN